MLRPALLLIMISLVGANHLRIGQMASSSNDDEILLRREMSGGLVPENRLVFRIEPTKRTRKNKGSILPNNVEEPSANEAASSDY
jgi:hypothetical protein